MTCSRFLAVRNRLPLPRPARAFRSGARAAGILASVVSVGALLAVTLPGLVGYHNITITSGSMGSALPTGSVAVTRTVNFRHVHVGDVIAFQRATAGIPVVHRIVEIRDTDAGRIAVTRGDANADVDAEPLVIEQGTGDRVEYYVPWLGYALVFIRAPGGLIALAAVSAIVCVGRRHKQEARAESHASPTLAS